MTKEKTIGTYRAEFEIWAASNGLSVTAKNTNETRPEYLNEETRESWGKWCLDNEVGND